MGIFPEINRVWLTVDNHLYLWNYEGVGKEETWYNVHADPDQPILSVSLVKPISGVFLEQIEYLLVIATTLEISILGIAFSEPKVGDKPRGQLTIYRTEMSCHADSVNMKTIIGTSNGRIFMLGNDGQLFELEYQAQEQWFHRKVRKLNRSSSNLAVFVPSFFNWALSKEKIKLFTIDSDRNIIYTVSESNHIDLISLGRNGDEFSIKASYTKLQSALQSFNSYDDLIVSIHPISQSESKRVQLVAINSSGARIFFTINNGGGSIFSGSNNNSGYIEPRTLDLLYVLAPPTIPGGMANPNAKIHESFYANGVTVAVQVNDNVDKVMVFAPQSGTILQSQSRYLSESASTYEVAGRTWAIVEAPTEQFFAIRRESSEVGYYLNELATQFDYSARKFFLLTNSGLFTLTKLRPLDLLLKLIYESPINDIRVYSDFFKSYGHDQCCAMSLAIACAHPSISSGQFGVIPDHISTIAKKIFFELGGVATFRSSQANLVGAGRLGIPVQADDFSYSHKHNGLLLYLARVLRPLWKKDIVSKSISNGVESIDSRLSNSNLVPIQLNLKALRKFLDGFPSFITAPTPATRPSQGDHEAWKKEQQSLANIYRLIIGADEAITFLSFLIDFKITKLFHLLNDQEKKDLKSLTFEMLVVSQKGKDVAKSLMTALVNNQINNEMGAESVILSLEQKCPTICEGNDVIYYRGMEHLRSAKSVANQSTSGQQLMEGYTKLCSIIKYITIERLTDIVVNYFRPLRFYKAVVDICLLKAAEYFSDNTMDGNQVRHQCYQLIFDTMFDIEKNFDQSNGSIRLEEVESYRSTILSVALESTDQMFHNALYAWFLNQGLVDKLLEVKTDYLEKFLIDGQQENLQFSDLLCGYYVRHGRFFAAAQLSYQVATKREGLTLNERLTRLTTAITNAKSSTEPERQDLFGQIKDELDIARVQSKIIAKLKTLPDTEMAVETLSYQLLSISDLFVNYARMYQLHEIMLEIIYLSEMVSDKILIIIDESWTAIINNTYRDSQSQGQSAYYQLGEKIKELGRILYPSEHVFPIKSLIWKLEELSIVSNESFPAGWVCENLLALGVPYKQIFQVYHDLIESKQSPWSSSKGIRLLIQNAIYLIEKWFDHIRSPIADRFEREEYPVRIIDEALSNYLITTPNDAGSLRDSLTRVQSRVRSAF
ncbi:Nup133 N terminal like-domain-containing protein [Globomyces pollinis-pini]|nr:Nup133 N terminal like-domain-containing protein [Globomyces pollinis-pini]